MNGKKSIRLSGMGFQVPKPIYHENTEKIEDTIREVESFMMEGQYLVDGIVFTYDSLALHEELGSTSHHPRYRLAFKFQGERARTEVISITWSVSRNGHLIPVGHVTPVALSGAKISRVTLHNYSQVKENGIKEGDEIEIVRSGEVIPKFLSVTKSKQGKTCIPSYLPCVQNGAAGFGGSPELSKPKMFRKGQGGDSPFYPKDRSGESFFQAP